MNSCGLIVRYMSRQDWKGEKFLIKLRTMFFNLCLLIYQLTLIIVGTVYGKIKWPKDGPEFIDYVIVIISFSLALLSFLPLWLYTYFFLQFVIIAIATLRGIDWRKTWRAAKASHVRLVLENVAVLHYDAKVANFGYPTMAIQLWDNGWNDGKYLEYREPTFPTPPQFIEPMIQYAHDQVGLQYDEFQLISHIINLPLWIIYPPCWGKEVIKVANRPGGKEHCISGVTACLRWAYLIRYRYSPASAKKMLSEGYAEYGTIFFEGYDTATPSPCLVPLSKNWEVT